MRERKKRLLPSDRNVSQQTQRQGAKKKKRRQSFGKGDRKRKNKAKGEFKRGEVPKTPASSRSRGAYAWRTSHGGTERPEERGGLSPVDQFAYFA